MKVIGLTGGIGTGKTTIANMFHDLGIPIYIADDEAKKIMMASKVVRKKLIELFGNQAYIDDKLNKPFIASKIFNDQTYLKKINAIIHPKVALHFKRWLKKQTSKYVIKEAAIIFEHNMQEQFDYIITVIADTEDRINRVLKRENTSRAKILTIINNQLKDDEKVKMSDFVIVNGKLEDTRLQVFNIHISILQKL
jgi:dephospho-CoA kinase